MLIVCGEQALVEAELVDGLFGCASCRGVLGPWGHARERVLRCRLGSVVAASPHAVPGLRGHACAIAGSGVGAPPGRGVGDRVGDRGEDRRRGIPADRRTVGGARGARCVVGYGGSLSAAGRSGRISRGGWSRWIRNSGRCWAAGSGIADALEAIAAAVRAWVL